MTSCDRGLHTTVIRRVSLPGDAGVYRLDGREGAGVQQESDRCADFL